MKLDRVRLLGSDPVPIVGQGTWMMEQNHRCAIRALRRGLDLGSTHIDTAEMYGSGRVEEIVGEAIAGRRNDVFLVSKVLPHHASRSGTIAACERSLRRLATDRLDLYLLHWLGPHPLEETIAAFVTLEEQGKIRRFGVSNFDVPELETAVRIAGKGRIACNQVFRCTTSRSVRLNTAFCLGAERGEWRWSPTAHSALVTSLSRPLRVARHCRR